MDKNRENLIFISTDGNQKEISELHFKIYSKSLKRTFTKCIKISEIYQVREKIDRDNVTSNPNFFLSNFFNFFTYF
jgi:hypothetical protein